jgi:lysophospholipase L1-like esterase
MLRYHRRMDANVPDHAVVVIGDSLVQGLCTDAIAQPSVNYGIGSDTTVGVLGRLAAYQDSMRRASAAILAIGVNDLLHRDNPEILANYRRILEAIPPGPAIVCSALLPINERTYPRPSPVRNARIQDLNAGLRTLCAENPRWHFVDAGPQLVDAEGNLLANLEDGDGIHLNPAGNRLWIEALRSALRNARPPEPNLIQFHRLTPAVPPSRSE